MTSTSDSPNFFKRADYNEEYWNNYLAARPVYDQPFYQLIYDYHKSHGEMETALDVGTGPGQVASELSKHFDKVIASDNNAPHLAVAHHRLQSLITSKRVEIAQSSGEELTDILEPNSVDLVTAAECLPLVDAEKAITAFSAVLKRNGTAAIWFYGRPVFAEPEFRKSCQPILELILDTSFAKSVKGGGPQHKAGWKRATDRMASFLDDVEFKEDVWQNVQRRKWNSEYAMPFYGPDACDFDITPTSNVGPEEKIFKNSKADFWERQWDLGAVKRFVLANLPTFDRETQVELEDQYKELGQAMGREGETRKITWPVVLILATKT